MIGVYRLKEDKRFHVGVSSIGKVKGSTVEVKQIDKENRKVLIDFGYGFIDWFSDRTLSSFDRT